MLQWEEAKMLIEKQGQVSSYHWWEHPDQLLASKISAAKKGSYSLPLSLGEGDGDKHVTIRAQKLNGFCTEDGNRTPHEEQHRQD